MSRGKASLRSYGISLEFVRLYVHIDKPATGVPPYRLRGGSGCRPRAKRAALVSILAAHTEATVAAITAKMEKSFIAAKGRRKWNWRESQDIRKHENMADLSYLSSAGSLHTTFPRSQIVLIACLSKWTRNPKKLPPQFLLGNKISLILCRGLF